MLVIFVCGVWKINSLLTAGIPYTLHMLISVVPAGPVPTHHRHAGLINTISSSIKRVPCLVWRPSVRGGEAFGS